jgi:putative nucleotidyltransferase with HDIG domain
MKQPPATPSAARQVELIIRRLNSLSTLPAVSANLLAELSQPNISASALSQIIEADPALTARVLSLAHRQGLAAVSVAAAMEKLPIALVRDAILSVKVFQVFDADYDPDKKRLLPRKQLAIHGLAVACCAKEIVQTLQGQYAIDPQLAFSAGLLHDIGKLAIDEVMPKSFERVVAEAKSAGASAAQTERKYLGIDHCIVGKRLAEKWGLPNEITLAIWLHHSDPDAIAQNMPDAGIAQIVRFADIVARSCQLGNSGSFDEPLYSAAMLESLGLTQEQLDSIAAKLPQLVAQKTQLLSLNSEHNAQMWCDAIHTTATAMAKDNTRLASENALLQNASGLCGLITDFLSSITSTQSAIEIAAGFAAMLQRFYQTGPVCIYLLGRSAEALADAVIINENHQTDFLLLKSTSDMPLLPQRFHGGYALLDAFSEVPWLFEQLSVHFDTAATKIAPLIANGRTVGALAVEFSHTPGNDELSNFHIVVSTAAAIIALAQTHQRQELMSEQLAQTLGQLKQAQQQLADAQALQAVAELAAGAAHELNNPLAVISGRAQLLEEVEADQNRKQMLKQIEDRAHDISGIVEDLMSFAMPEPTDAAQNSLRAIIDDAIQQTAKKHNLAALEVKLDNLEDLPQVYVDNGQVAAAVSNVLSNALESYPGGNGPVSISSNYLEAAETVELKIQDQGCGMDGETLRKAMLPFFSAKAAGRKRGMGLAQTQRLIQLNKGSIRLASQVNSGTTVTITLPCRE